MLFNQSSLLGAVAIIGLFLISSMSTGLAINATTKQAAKTVQEAQKTQEQLQIQGQQTQEELQIQGNQRFFPFISSPLRFSVIYYYISITI